MPFAISSSQIYGGPMKSKLFLLTLFVFGWCTSNTVQAAESVSARERRLTIQGALRDFELRKHDIYQDAFLKNQQPENKLSLSKESSSIFDDIENSCLQTCVDQCNGGSGSSACWTKCNTDGWSLNTCVGNCGVSTSSGSGACWERCNKDGWSLSTCKDTCKTTTNIGSSTCWTRCNKDGWSLSTCVGYCGVSTQGAINICWDRCTKDGWSLSTCKSTCGTN